MDLYSKAFEFAKAYPEPDLHPYGGGSNWDQMCGSLMNRMCEEYGDGPTGDIRSAYIVYERSAIVSKDPSKALVGDFHFWDIAGRANGHVGLELSGTGENGGIDVFMATWSVRDSWGQAIGTQSVDGYTRAKGGRARYLGFSRSYANGDVRTAAATAGGGTTPLGGASLPIPRRTKDHDMLFLRVDDDGNGTPFFTVLNTNTNVWYPPVTTIAPAGWTKAFGPHVEYTRADFLGLLNTIYTLTGQKPWVGTRRS